MIKLSNFFQNNIYIDPLTGMPNLFNLIESDANNIFGEKGYIILFDIVDFTSANEKYGTYIGDMCLRCLADSIRAGLLNCENSSAFRTNGDEFTTILPYTSYSQIQNVVKSIKETFELNVLRYGVCEVELYPLIINYSKKITSITEFYQIVFEELYKVKQQDKSIKKQWIDHIIGNFINRISETLTVYNDVYNLALTDDTTGLSNSRAAKIYLTELFNKKIDTNKEFSILFIDGDNLRIYNEISYQRGNEMIKELSAIISKSIRKNDKIFRWLSGDEFLVVFENTNAKDALKLAERVRKSVEGQTQKWIYPITISIGLSSYPSDGKELTEIIENAEKANTYAKNTGKNKVIEWKTLEALSWKV